MTLTNATTVMTTKTRTQAPSSRRSPSRPTLPGLGDDLLGGLHEGDAHLPPPFFLPGGGPAPPPRPHLGRRLADDPAVGGREAVPRELRDRDDHGVDRVVPRREVLLRVPQLERDDDADDRVLLAVHRPLLEGLLRLAPVHVDRVGAERAEGVDEEGRAERAG